jgi:hypothetical protein
MLLTLQPGEAIRVIREFACHAEVPRLRDEGGWLTELSEITDEKTPRRISGTVSARYGPALVEEPQS